MTYSISCSNNLNTWLRLVLILVAIGLSGCAGILGSDSRVLPAPTADIDSPQMATSVEVNWTSIDSYPDGWERNFQLRRKYGEVTTVQTSTSRVWQWSPETPGKYQVRILSRDSEGRKIVGQWSAYFEISDLVSVDPPRSDIEAPQVADTVGIAWTARGRGGVAPLKYQYEIEKDGVLINRVMTDTEPNFDFRPAEAGDYRLRVTVRDLRGNQVTSRWTESYRIEAPLKISKAATQALTPHVLGEGGIRWTVEAAGGLGRHTYVFEWRESQGPSFGDVKTLSPDWTWEPDRSGTYRVRVRVRDELGNEQTGAWSKAFVVVKPVQIRGLNSDKPKPQTAGTSIRWQAEVVDGVPPYHYQFELQKDDAEARFVHQGAASWDWKPQQKGKYRVRVKVADARGYMHQSDWSKVYDIAAPLQIEPPKPSLDSEQLLIEDRTTWSTAVRGGVGAKKLIFYLQKRGGDGVVVQESSQLSWKWLAGEEGFYRVRVVVVDRRGNRRESDWSSWKEVRASLKAIELKPDKPSPQAALISQVTWNVKTTGGVGQLNYEFHVRNGKRTVVAQNGLSDTLIWRPKSAGNYSFKATVTDERLNRTETAWSPVYAIEPAIRPDAFLAVLPIENLSGKKADLVAIKERIETRLRDSGSKVLGNARLEDFLFRHRVRYTGGIGTQQSQRFKDEEGVDAALVTTIESYADQGIPQLALTLRLVLCSELPKIAWIDSIGLTGEDSPGLLGLNRVSGFDPLLDMALDKLMASLNSYLERGRLSENSSSSPDQPDDYYLSSDFVVTAPYRIAVVPFLNRFSRRNTGFIVPLHLVKELHGKQNMEVFEPGVVREQLLKYRLIMRAGPSLATADVLFNPNTLSADLVLSGDVFDFQDNVDNPKVNFSTRLFSSDTRGVVWWSNSYAAGKDNVFFYNVNRVRSAHALLKSMTKAIGDLISPF